MCLKLSTVYSMYAFEELNRICGFDSGDERSVSVVILDTMVSQGTQSDYDKNSGEW